MTMSMRLVVSAAAVSSDRAGKAPIGLLTWADDRLTYLVHEGGATWKTRTKS